MLCIAIFLGNKFFMHINDLHVCDCCVTGPMARIASIGAAVGILGRARPGFPHG
jgi:hypothetical protein